MEIELKGEASVGPSPHPGSGWALELARAGLRPGKDQPPPLRAGQGGETLIAVARSVLISGVGHTAGPGSLQGLLGRSTWSVL